LAGLISLCLVAFALPSCSTSQGGKEKVLSLYEVHLQVDQPMMRYRNALVFGAVTEAQRKAVEQAYQEFKTAYDSALAAAGGKEHAKTTPAPDNVKAAAEMVKRRVDTLM